MNGNMKNNGYDIIILAGQSNAEGNGWHTADDKEIINDRVYHLIDANPVGIYENEKGEAVLDIKMPAETILEVAHERVWEGEPIADFSETFADEYIKGGNLKGDRKVLIVKAAVGGAGFAKKQWGVGNPLSDRLFEMTDRALSYSGENRVVALLWHQGEHDACENSALNEKERYVFYYDNFYRQMKAVRDRYDKYAFPVIAGGFVPHWKWGLENEGKVQAVYRATQAALKDLGGGKFVSAEGLKSNDEAIRNGDDIHFCASSVYELGRRYYSAFAEINNKRL